MLADGPALAARLGPLLGWFAGRARRCARAARLPLRAAAAARRPEVRLALRSSRSGSRTGASLWDRTGEVAAAFAATPAAWPRARPAVDRGPLLDLGALPRPEDRPRRAVRGDRRADALRARVLGPLLAELDGRDARGVRRIEESGPAVVERLEATVPVYSASGCLEALHATIAVYAELRDETDAPSRAARSRRGSRARVPISGAIRRTGSLMENAARHARPRGLRAWASAAWACSEFYGDGRRGRVDRDHPPRARPRRDLPRHRRHVRPVHQRAAGRPGDRRPPRRGRAGHQVRQRARRGRRAGSASTARPSTCARRATRRCSGSASTTSTSTTSTASTTTVPIEETVGAMAELVDGGQGAPPRAVRGGARDDPPRARGAPDHRAADRVLAVDPRPRGRRSCRPCRELGIGFVAYSPLGRGFLTGAIPVARRPRRRTTSAATTRASRARTSQQNLELVDAGRGDRRREGRARRPSSRWRGCSRRATTSCRSRARSACATSRRTPRRVDVELDRRRPARGSTRPPRRAPPRATATRT